jgi:hypothetical protein
MATEVRQRRESVKDRVTFRMSRLESVPWAPADLTGRCRRGKDGASQLPTAAFRDFSLIWDGEYDLEPHPRWNGRNSQARGR